MNKKGQMGDLLTWFPAFLIIFFVILAYVGLASYMTTGKVLTKGNEISYSENAEVFWNTDAQKQLLDFLGNEFSGGKNGKDLIADYYGGNGDDEDLRAKIKEFFGKDCYSFEINNGDKKFIYDPLLEVNSYGDSVAPGTSRIQRYSEVEIDSVKIKVGRVAGEC
jgi:hypothetical protein